MPERFTSRLSIRPHFAAALLLIVPFAASAIPATPSPDGTAAAHDSAPVEGAARRATATRIERGAIHLDGRLDENAWREAPCTGRFVQRDPDEGAPCTEKTEIVFLYDADALYVGARLHREDVGDILASVSRRDKAGNSERIIVTLDTYHDRRTSYSFAVTATGVRIDYYHPKDGEYPRDYSYDPVWEARAHVGEGMWTAEMRIPFSQLRFDEAEEMMWGLNMNRWMPAENEDSYWVLVPSDETGWASRFGTLEGIRGIRPSRRVELQPYFAGDAQFSNDVERGDPFRDGSDFGSRAGGDLKMGVGPNLTLDVTVNPDFGQVEADPATVNLTAFEVFYEEKRPFFIEGSDLLAGNGPEYFYSRRIGGPPQREIDDDESDYVDAPDNSSILAAGKMTGRLPSGLSVGVLGAATAREYADVDSGGGKRREKVEPLTGYGVFRAQQEFGADRSTVGISLTGVRRDFQGTAELREILNRQTYAGGGDWNLRFRGGDCEVNGYAGFSRIEGDSSAVIRAQRSSRRYFQRPDADYVDVDSSRTSMAGYTVNTRLEKLGGNWLYTLGANAESPGFEINDAGSLYDTDNILTWADLRFRQTKPGTWYDNYNARLYGNTAWNYGGVRTRRVTQLEYDLVWPNFYSSWIGVWTGWGEQNDALTRGGPLMRSPRSWTAWLGTQSNWAADTWWKVHNEYSGDQFGSWGALVETELTFKVGDRWTCGIEPAYRRQIDPRQYIDEREGGRAETYGKRYIFSWIDRSTLSAEFRLDYSLTPDLSLELYAEPFVSSGRYYGYGELEAPGSRYLITYGEEGETGIAVNEDGSRTVTDGDETFDLDNDDFNYFSFRSNAVVRWEWRRGSTLFLVWQQNREADENNGGLVSGGDLLDTFRADGENIVALKVTYWIPYN